MKDRYKKLPLSFNRKAVIASASVTREMNTIHFFSEVDISVPRGKIRRYHEEKGEKLSFTAYIVSCLAYTMKKYPEYNSFIRGRHIIQLEDLTISVLVERLLEGERVPEPLGIEKADLKSYLEIHGEIRSAMNSENDTLGSLSGKSWIRLIPGFLLKLFIRIADKSISMNQKYGKVAVTAPGMYCREPLWVIPHGSATVLVSVGSIISRPVQVDAELDSREHLCLTVSFDHNIVDGAPAGRFMNDFLGIVKSGDLIDA